MHRLFRLILSGASIALLIAAPLTQPTTAQVIDVIATNTPPPLAFATNTPIPSPSNTPTPSQTPSPTLTPSATLTPTNTATFTLTPSLTPTSTFTPSPTPTLVGPVQYPDGFNPLTGLPYPSTEAFERRNILLKISNFPPLVRPQSGINMADVIYEYEVEGGVTRFAAIYRSQAPDHVGPIRSGRLLDVELVTMYEALFGYSGASEQVTEVIRAQPWWSWVIAPARGDNCEEAGYCRFPEEGRPFEHTLYTNTNLIWERATLRGVNMGFRARGFAFSDVIPERGEAANDVFIDYYGQTDARWQYRADSGRYERYTEGQPHMDAADGDQLWADNVVIIEVPHIDRPDLFEPESKSASHQIALWGQGRAYVFRDGQYYQGFWRRECRGNEETVFPGAERVNFNGDECLVRAGDALQLLFGDNTPIHLQPGRTWVMVTRWMNYVTVANEQPDIEATWAIQRLTPTNTPWPTATVTPAN